jgi:hypothetical protein
MAKLEDKTLTPAEQVRLREFVQEVWTTAYSDYEGVTGSLGEEAEVAAELENIRRLAERGKAYNERSRDHDLDLFNEILSTVERINNDNKKAQDSSSGHRDSSTPSICVGYVGPKRSA